MSKKAKKPKKIKKAVRKAMRRKPWKHSPRAIPPL